VADEKVTVDEDVDEDVDEEVDEELNLENEDLDNEEKNNKLILGE
jgi:hypothetical protein